MIVDGNNVIAHYLKNNIPLAAGKIGGTEIKLLQSCFDIGVLGVNIPIELQKEAEEVSGLYPCDKATVRKFSEEFVTRLPEMDLMPLWWRANPAFEKHIFDTFCPKTFQTQLQHLEPYFFEKPWTNQLEGKTVLVFSPFAESIERNFKNLDKIWNNKIKPNFKLKAFYYPFAIPINSEAKQKYGTSQKIFGEYTDLLRSEIFDVGIFGTGHTSLFFVTECKRLGKAGIHLGGSTQILFGVKGQRWREIQQFQPFFNEYWTDPLEREKPDLRFLVEGGAYW